ncbi:MAG: hypothetical protein N3D20_02695 [Candidatus Pacearchaeota archaeon]|nr:hypothetical protein [Candidatus Pacearchaeota archaeon]
MKKKKLAQKENNHILKKIKYPKFILFLLTVIIAYIIFKNREIPFIQNHILPLSYFGVFISGTLFTFGFTSAPATALFLLFAENVNPIIAALIGGAGALLADSLIFLFIRTSFKDEIIKLEHEKIIHYIETKIPSKIKRIILPIIAGLIIASPLPDEIGISMLAAYRTISPKFFASISYLMNTIGILIILLIGRAI